MGSKLSHLGKGENYDGFEKRKGFQRFGYGRKSKRGPPPPTNLQPEENESCSDAQHVSRGSLLPSTSSTTPTTCETEKSEKRNSTLQRTLPAIPCSDKDKIEPIYEVPPTPSELMASVRYTHSRRDDAPEPRPQTLDHPTDDRGSEVEVDRRQEDPLGKLCRPTGKESVLCSSGDSKPRDNSTLNGSVHFEDVAPPEEPDSRSAAASEDIYMEVNRGLASETHDVTYMQIDGADNSQTARKRATSESSENDGVPKAGININEMEDGYVPAGPVMVNGTSSQTIKAQAVVGPTSGTRKKVASIVHPPVRSGINGALSETSVEIHNTVQTETKKAKAYIILKTDFGPNSCTFEVRVLMGCLEYAPQQTLMEVVRLYEMDGYKRLDGVEFGLFPGESVLVKISKIKWTDGQVIHGDLDTEEFGWFNRLEHGSVEAKFWQRSRMANGGKPEVFAATLHIQQDDRQDMRTKLYCPLESPIPFGEQRHTPVDDYPIYPNCGKPATDIPCGGPLVTDPHGSSHSNSDDKLVSLHADSSVPEAWASISLCHQKKEIETEKTVTPSQKPLIRQPV